MLVKDTMQKAVRTCQEGDSLAAAARVMWDHDCGCTPVVDAAGRVHGMITDRDICMSAYTSGRRLQEVKVMDVMAKQLATVMPDESLTSAQMTMRTHGVRRLPVVDRQGRLVGLLSINDVCRSVESTGSELAMLEASGQLVATIASVGRARSSAAALVPYTAPGPSPGAQPSGLRSSPKAPSMTT